MRKLTIVVTSMNAVGHVNACAGALSGLVARGHRVIFILEKAFEGTLKPLGYEEYIYSAPIKKSFARQNGESARKENPGEKLAQVLVARKIIGNFTPYEKLEKMMDLINDDANNEDVLKMNECIKEVIQEYKPDLFYLDGPFYPAVYFSGIPYIRNNSMTPIFISRNLELPPGGSGLPSDDPTDWPKFVELRKQFFNVERLNKIVVGAGYEPLPHDFDWEAEEKRNLTVYAYPEELNYPQIRAQPNWFNLEVFNKTPASDRVKLNTILPTSFLIDDLDGKFSGKLIYLTMGSMGSVDLDLMHRLIKALGKTSHKYIVSKGPRFAAYELAANMYGDRYLPQTKIVPHVDLVITHGGNNTVTEAFSEGKPMIVIALFGDQFDNAQRLHETGLGAKIDPYNFTESKLIKAVDQILNDVQLRETLQNAAKRIHQSNRHEELAIKIEQMLQ